MTLCRNGCIILFVNNIWIGAFDIKYLSEKEFENCLKNIGCDKSVIEQFFKSGMSKHNMLDILYKQRISALEKLHPLQDKLNCIDYLIYQIKKR